MPPSASQADLDKALRDINARINVEREVVAMRKDHILSYRGAEAWNSERASVTKRLYNLKETKHVLNLLKNNPNRAFFGQTTIVGIADESGKIIKRFGRGKIRIADWAEVSGRWAQLGDIKSGATIVDSVKGGKSDPDIEAVFKSKSAIAAQHGKEAAAISAAAKRNGYLVLRIQDVLTGKSQTINVHHANLRTSIVTDYYSVHESTLPRPKPPKVPPTARPAGKPAKKPGSPPKRYIESRRSPRAPEEARGITGTLKEPARAGRGITEAARSRSAPGQSSRLGAGAAATAGIRPGTATPRLRGLRFRLPSAKGVASGLRAGLGSGVRLAQSYAFWDFHQTMVDHLSGQAKARAEYEAQEAMWEAVRIRGIQAAQKEIDNRVSRLIATSEQLDSVVRNEWSSDLEFNYGLVANALEYLGRGDCVTFHREADIILYNLRLTRDTAILHGNRYLAWRHQGVEPKLASDERLFLRFLNEFSEIVTYVRGHPSALCAGR